MIAYLYLVARKRPWWAFWRPRWEHANLTSESKDAPTMPRGYTHRICLARIDTEENPSRESAGRVTNGS